MPKRIVDADAMWTSTKLASCPLFARREYPWLLGLADVTGCFEITSIRSIHGRVAAIREDLTEDILRNIFAEYQKAGLLFVWSKDHHDYAFWVGMDKAGRLPSESRISKQEKAKCPLIPKNLLDKYVASTDSVQTSNRVRTMALAYVSADAYAGAWGETPRHSFEKQEGGQDEPAGDDVRDYKEIAFKIRTYFNDSVAEFPGKLDKAEAKHLVSEKGWDFVVGCLNSWLGTQDPTRPPKKPVAAFLAFAKGIPAGDQTTDLPVVDRGTIQNVVDRIAKISDAGCVYGSSNYADLGRMVGATSPDDVVCAFKVFWDQQDDFGKRRAMYTFLDQGENRAKLVADSRRDKARQDELLARLREKATTEGQVLSSQVDMEPEESL